MLVAQKKYDYDQLPDYKQYERRETKVREVVVTRRGAIRKVKAILAILLFFGLCLFLLFRYAQINEHNQRLGKLKAELSHVQKINSQLQIEQERQVNLSEIEQIAVQKLGMQYPDKNQTVHIQLKKSDFTETPEKNEKQQIENEVMAMVTQGLAELVKYLY